MADDEQNAAVEEKLDASYKPDAAILDGDEADFAKALGFSLEDSAGAETPSVEEAAPAPVEDGADVEDEPVPAALETESEEDEDEDEGDTTEEIAATAQSNDESAEADAAEEVRAAAEDADPEQPSPAPENDDEWGAAPEDEDDAPSVEYEDIQPRPATEGIQETLQERADEVMARNELDVPAAIMDAASAPEAFKHTATASGDALDQARTSLSERDRALAAALAELDATQADLAVARAELDGTPSADEKDLEEARIEIETVSIERDQLIDQLAATSGQLVQSQRTAENLEASLRAARGALVPLPEGERALRAEVIGLRGRLDEAAQENVRLASEVASVATELSIAAARVEDRQHEIDYHSDRAADLEAELEEKNQQLEATIARHRDGLALATRLQAENTELRSAQAALEETLQARDLEITAREEHLRVTREGLSTRDTQLVDLKEAVEQERHRIEALEADLERADIEKGVLLDKVARRESRIATLTNTLGRIEEAMGQRLQMAMPSQPVLAQAEWTRPTAPPNATGDPTPATADDPADAGTPATEPAASSPAFPAGPVVAYDAPVLKPEPELAPEFADLPTSSESASPSYDEDVTEQLDVSDNAEHAAEATPPRVLSVSPSLPPILGRWRDRRLEELEEAEAASVADFLADRLVGQLGEPGPEALFLRSLGGALPDAEVRLVTALQARGLEGIRMEVLDVGEEAAQARRHRIELACLGEVIDVRVGDLEDWNADAPCHAILVSDALHAQARPEAVLDHVAPTVARGALLLFTGRIGAGPVQLSASTLMRLEELWQLLPEPLASRDGLARAPFRGDDGGTPAAAIDPAAALVDRFEAIALAGFGHLADLVVGPSRGFAISDDEEVGRQLLESVVAIDESRGLTESLPPRHGVGVFALGSAGRTECFGQTWPCLENTLR